MTGLVQETSGSTTGTTLTFTFPTALTLGNSVVIALCGYYGGSVSGFTIGGTAVTFLSAANADSGPANCEVWACYGTPSSTTVTVTCSVAGIIGWAYELSGAVTLDLSAGTHGTGTSWSSGATAATASGWQHFVVGVGMHTGNTGSITGPSSGWTNETAYSNVASGGSHVGGISGYQQPSSGGTYTYSGTQATSSAWAALSAAFLCAPRPAQVNSIWGGYAFTEHASAGYTGVSATMTVPSVSAGPSGAEISAWVGLGNVYQCGVFITYSTSYASDTWVRPWSWWLPGAGEDWSQATYPAAVGDTLTFTMQLTSANWLMTIANSTQGWSFTETRSVLAVNIGSIQNNGAGPATWIFPLTQAEVIVEKESTFQLNYGSLSFSSVTTTPAVTAAPSPVFTAAANLDQYPGAFTLSGGAGSFTMNYHAAS